jgi:hypothetical protein
MDKMFLRYRAKPRQKKEIAGADFLKIPIILFNIPETRMFVKIKV